VRRAIARAFGHHEAYTCDDSSTPPDSEVLGPFQLGFQCESPDGGVRFVLLEPERRLQMHLGTGTYRDVALSATGIRGWSAALAVLLRERREQARQFYAEMGARVASAPVPSVAPTSTSDTLDLTGSVPLEPYVKGPPTYPDLAREAGVDGTVLLDVLVGSDGLVHDIKVMKSIPMLDQAAKDAVRRWRFRPYVRDGVSHSVWTRVPVKFALH